MKTAKSTPGLRSTPGSSRKLMLVDDDRDDRYFFQKAVASLQKGYSFMEASNGQEALDILRGSANPPDYIFLDINMPIMNGKECLRELKKDDKLKRIPVIMYSTSSAPEDMALTAELGACFYLNKAIDILKLPAEIEKALKRADEFISC